MEPLDLVQKFPRREKEITTQCEDDKRAYFQSPDYAGLYDRYQRLKSSNDMEFGSPRNGSASSGDNFFSNISMPMVKQRTMVREAMFSHNFRGDPLITLSKTANGSSENAKNAQSLLIDNFKVTEFRSQCFRRVKYDAARYGAAVVNSRYNHSQKTGMVLEKTQFGIEKKIGIVDEQHVVENAPEHILNYFQEPGIVFAKNARYRGVIRRTTLADLIGEYKMNKDSFIDKNIKAIFKQAKDFIDGGSSGGAQDQDAYKAYSYTNQGNMPMDVVCMYNKLNTIKGNEANTSHYYIEMIAGKIIRFEHNPYVYDEVPISIFTYYPREEFWWGNCDGEFVLPHENFMNTIMKKKADLALNALEQYIFYNKDSIDPYDWESRHENGGMIAVRNKDIPLRDILHQSQPIDASTNTVDSMIRYLQANADGLAPNSASTRDPALLRSDTAAAVHSMESSGDVLESHILEGFSYGLRDLGRINITLLQQFLGDRFKIAPDPRLEDLVLDREQILGRFGYNTDTALTKNKTFEQQRLQNILTGLMNFKGSQDPTWQNVNMTPIIQNWLKNADVGDMEEILPPQAQQPQNIVQGPGAAPNPFQQGAIPNAA